MRNRLIFSYSLVLLLLAAPAQAQSLTWIGEAPFCNAEPAQCEAQGMTFVLAHPSGNGEACLTGTKVLCKGTPAPAIAPGTKLAACPLNAKKLSAPLRCQCKANVRSYPTIWGSGPYTNDSSVCGAARHAGVIGLAGGAVLIEPAAGQSSYRGSKANGISTRKYGKWPGSFRVRK